jgi:cellulose synthase/poly-beta-1,6-N-acetylglucosamine synthase-like glycosyltransferase
MVVGGMKDPEEASLIGLVASKNPVPALEATVKSLFKGGATRVFVVDDGSDDPDSLKVFDRVEKIGGEVVHLKKNGGKARALRAGFWIIPKHSIIVQTDDDTLAGDLTGPLRMIREGKADIVDIRVETVRTHSLIGMMQEIDYWLINAVSKRVQNWINARLWMSGASVMYTYEAGQVILQPPRCITEDTEGLYRARSKGFRMRFYSKHDAEFLTMVPEDFKGMNKQWRRWATGNAQVLALYGLGGGNPRIAAVNAFCWLDMLIPIPAAIRYGVLPSLGWGLAVCALYGIVGAIRLKRPLLCFMGIFLPFLSFLWTYHSFAGIYRAWQLSKADDKSKMNIWVSPKRTVVLETTTS